MELVKLTHENIRSPSAMATVLTVGKLVGPRQSPSRTASTAAASASTLPTRRRSSSGRKSGAKRS